MKKVRKDLTGKRIGEWLVLRVGPDGRSGATRYHCRCSCGAEHLVHAGNLSKILKGGSRGSAFCRDCNRDRTRANPPNPIRSNTVVILGAVAVIDISTKKLPFARCLVDTDAVARLVDGRGRWGAVQLKKGAVYAQRRVAGSNDRVTEFMHRVLLGLPRSPGHQGAQGDHISGDTLDNRLCNLRVVTPEQNARNSRPMKGAVSKFKGVHRRSSARAYSKNKWVAALGSGKSRVYLGVFATEEAAARAYDVACSELHGEFGRTNKSLGLLP